MLRWSFGQRRKRTGCSTILLVLAALSCITTVPLIIFGVPTSWLRAREVRTLPQPTAAELDRLARGTTALIAVRLPADDRATGHGLALFYVETRQRMDSGTSSNTDEEHTWHIEQPPPQQVTLLLDNDAPLTVQIPQTTPFHNAQEIEADAPDMAKSGPARNEREYRYTGYLPGQTLTIEGTWEGDDLVTARALYAGAPTAYREHMARKPGNLLLGGLFCSIMGVVLLLGGLALRVLGK